MGILLAISLSRRNSRQTNVTSFLSLPRRRHTWTGFTTGYGQEAVSVFVRCQRGLFHLGIFCRTQSLAAFRHLSSDGGGGGCRKPVLGSLIFRLLAMQFQTGKQFLCFLVVTVLTEEFGWAVLVTCFLENINYTPHLRARAWAIYLYDIYTRYISCSRKGSYLVFQYACVSVCFLSWNVLFSGKSEAWLTGCK